MHIIKPVWLTHGGLYLGPPVFDAMGWDGVYLGDPGTEGEKEVNCANTWLCR